MVGEHTPGPWAVSREGNAQDAILYVQHVAGGDGVTDPCGAFTVAMLRYGFALKGNAETRANARLIAAAPTMLAALERIANEPCDHGPGFCPREVARATIAAAK